MENPVRISLIISVTVVSVVTLRAVAGDWSEEQIGFTPAERCWQHLETDPVWQSVFDPPSVRLVD